MVTNYGGTGDLMCSSTDVKPTDVAVNTRCLELDTGKFWFFNGTSWTETPGGGGGGSATLIEKSITANGTYNASSDDADGYSSVDVNVPNTYTVDDNGKVVLNQQLVSQTAKPDAIIVNDTYNTTEYNSVTVNVPNTYTAGDEGKVVSGGDLVAQTAYPSTIVTNGTYDTTLNNSVTVDVPTGGGVTEKDVNFYDYDGTLVYSYTAQEFLALTELPANPTHTGLTVQGWNWSLTDAKTYVTSYSKLNIGQMYVTDDGKTRLYIHLEDGRLSPVTSLRALSSTSGTIDWGDGTTPVNFTIASYDTTNLTHSYNQSGDYVISIAVNSGRIDLTSDARACILWGNGKADNAYRNSIRKIEIGSNVRISSSAFFNCTSLKSVTIPSGVTSIGSKAFQNCYSLKSVTIPSSVTSIGDYAFNNCTSLTSVTIPSSVTSIGQYAFQNCYSLTSVTIPSSVTNIGTYAFNNCTSLTSVTIPSTVTSIGTYAFSSCYSLKSVTIPSGVTSIGNYTFQYCYSLTTVTIPSGVTSIGGGAFYNCSSFGYIKFESMTPPTVANANAWQYLPTDCKIYVPTGSLTTYTSASNYPDPSTYTYVEY